MNSLRFRILRSHLLVIALTMVIFMLSVMLIIPRVHDRLLRDEEAVFRANATLDGDDNQQKNDPNDGIAPFAESRFPMLPGESTNLRRFENSTATQW